MKNQTFQSLLLSLNKQEEQEFLFAAPLTDTVEIANFWESNDDTSHPVFYGPNTLYIIKEFKGGQYVGVVHDRGQNDLHWYCLPEFRGKGFLSRSLRSVILPHIFQDNRDFQRISINSKNLTREEFSASSGLATALGFTSVGESDGISYFQLERESLGDIDYIDGELAEFTPIRAEQMRSEIRSYICRLQIIHSELEMKLGKTDDVLEMKESLINMKNSFDSLIINAYEDGIVDPY